MWGICILLEYFDLMPLYTSILLRFREELYFLLYYINLTAVVSSYFANYFTYKTHEELLKYDVL